MLLQSFSGSFGTANPMGTINGLVGIMLSLLLAFFSIFWLGILIWGVRDIRSRTGDLSLQLLAMLPLLSFPIIGTLIYLAWRPSSTLIEKYQKQLDLQSLHDEIYGELYCNHCHKQIKEDFQVCPNCGKELKQVCPNCERLLNPDWAFCSYCATELRPEIIAESSMGPEKISETRREKARGKKRKEAAGVRSEREKRYYFNKYPSLR